MSWICPNCSRAFRRVRQKHVCARLAKAPVASLLKDRPVALANLYRKLETTVRGFGRVEVVTDFRYALFRTTRIFADLTVMKDALRVVVHLSRAVSLQRGARHQPARSMRAETSQWVKVGRSGKRVSHVALVRTAKDLRAILPFLRESYDLAVSEEMP